MKKGFTLAEVLITLGIIGVVAALTMPTLIANYQKTAIKSQFKKSYSVLQQALLKAQADLDYQPECYYWDSPKYTGGKCLKFSDDGKVCLQYGMEDGSPYPDDYNGKFSECTVLKAAILKNLNVIKTCENQAYSKGCIPEYEGMDTVMKANDDSLSDYDINSKTAGCAGYNKQSILNSRTVYVLSDGMLIIAYNFPQIFAVDVNGKKAPNKWGYDLFPFAVKGNVNKPLTVGQGGCAVTEKGGVSTLQMIIDSSK